MTEICCIFFFDLAYLQEKPSVGRKSGGGNGAKAKRNTYIKHLLKQNENRAVVGKVLTNDKELSKKRRDRLLSSLNDDLSIDVEYSLNRKNRWETISTAADLVKGSDEGDGIVVSGVDAHYGVGLSKVSAYHQLDADGFVNTKKCSKPLNGVALESLLRNSDEKQRGKKRSKRLALAKLALPSSDNADIDGDEMAKPHVRYILRKPHPIPQLFGGSLFKRPSERSQKTRGRMDKIDTDYLDDIEMSASLHNDPQDECDMSASVAALYKAPKPQTFSLADFIKDTSPPVMVHFKSIESLADSSVKGDNDKVSATTSSSAAATSPLSASAISKTKMASKAYFEEFEILKQQFGISNFNESFEKLHLRPELKFRWLNDEKSRCVFDLTHLLDEHTFKIAMVVVVEALKSKEGYLRVLINGSFGCPSDVTEFVKQTTFKSPMDFIEELIKKVQKSYNDARQSTKNSSLASYNSVFHGHQLTLPVDPCGDYKIIDDAAARSPTVEAIIIDGPESEEDDDDDDEMEGFEEFEVIEMDDIISEVDEDEAKEDEAPPKVIHEEPEIIEDYDSGCDMCPEGNEDELIILDSCGHRFCRSCIRNDLTDAIVRRSVYPLMCLHENCKTPINLDFLVTILPLSIVEYYFRFAFMAENISDGKSVVECPHCHGSAAVNKKPTFGSVKCTKCSICFCARCDREPHFPLSCQQMDIWEKKFEKQYPVDVSRQTQGKTCKCECGEMIQNPKGLRQVTCNGCKNVYQWKTGEAIVRDGTAGATGATGTKKALVPFDLETLPNNIAGEFSKVCSISRTLRYDLTANRQITKNLCKVVDFRLKQAFIEIRKTALHILEYGFAWLYLNNKRGQKSATWSSIKAQLTLLRTKLDALHSQIANGQTDGIEAKINELNTLTQKNLDDFVVHA
uniref:RING-type domain-containing protein n=1 Tax=Panagrolaimus sp. ES5 TaxID=591445 RepID=A0AC34GNL7_9BILA